MRNIFPLLFVFSALTSYAQPVPLEYTPSFSAVIVKNMDASSRWYQSVLGLKVKEQLKDEKAGYNISILESPSFTLELLELKNSIDTKAGKPQDKENQGLFKIGFKVNDMDACLKQLATLNISVPQVWSDPKTKKRNFIITDPDGNLIQLFE